MAVEFRRCWACEPGRLIRDEAPVACADGTVASVERCASCGAAFLHELKVTPLNSEAYAARRPIGMPA